MIYDVTNKIMELMSKSNTSSTAFSLRRSEFLNDFISASVSPNSLSLSVVLKQKTSYQIPQFLPFCTCSNIRTCEGTLQAFICFDHLNDSTNATPFLL